MVQIYPRISGFGKSKVFTCDCFNSTHSIRPASIAIFFVISIRQSRKEQSIVLLVANIILLTNISLFESINDEEEEYK
jgi:hypothetical protein